MERAGSWDDCPVAVFYWFSRTARVALSAVNLVAKCGHGCLYALNQSDAETAKWWRNPERYEGIQQAAQK